MKGKNKRKFEKYNKFSEEKPHSSNTWHEYRKTFETHTHICMYNGNRKTENESWTSNGNTPGAWHSLYIFICSEYESFPNEKQISQVLNFT